MKGSTGHPTRNSPTPVLVKLRVVLTKMIALFFDAIIFLLSFSPLGNSFQPVFIKRSFLHNLKRDLRGWKRYFLGFLDVPIKGLDELEEITNFHLFRRRDPSLTNYSIRQVTEQLGYQPFNIISIAAFESKQNSPRSCLSQPLVALVYPLNFNRLNGRYKFNNGLRPFPTVLWMTCPELSAKVSRLEDDGWIAKLHARLNQPGTPYLEMMSVAHTRYAEFRWSLLTEEDKAYSKRLGWSSSLEGGVGIAGMHNRTAVRHFLIELTLTHIIRTSYPTDAHVPSS
jgi:hypothetical protein